MPQVRYYFDPEGRFTIEDYNRAKPFFSFLPGIAGRTGIPIWAFYTNRGQALAGFGHQDKDGAIQEFVPADKAPWYAAWRGFRTFIKLRTASGTLLYEPFRPACDREQPVRNRMVVTAAELELAEERPDLGLAIRVTYFTLPGAKLGALYRRTEIANCGAGSIGLEILDGLAAIQPAGLGDYHAKHMGATIQAWMRVSLSAGVPAFQLSHRPDDVPELFPVSCVHFHLGYTVEDGVIRHLPPIYDPAAVFGEGPDYQPIGFAAPGFRYPQAQGCVNFLPAAFSHIQTELPAGETLAIYGLFGRAPDEEALRAFLPEVDARHFEASRRTNRELIGGLADLAFTSSAQPLFDRYLGQCCLDNAVRGGIPVTFAVRERPKIFWLYSRKHGDLERDYNDFRLSPTYYSQGNGNFRDINQNRRHGVWFNPQVAETTLRYFWNLIQLDGFNPLVVKGTSYYLADTAQAQSILRDRLPGLDGRDLLALLGRPFTPGDLAAALERLRPAHPENQDLLAALLEPAVELEEADPSAEGYWIDHWLYNLDLFETFAAIYPDSVAAACFSRRDYTFYDNWVVQVPSDQRYRLIGGEVRLKGCVRVDEEKKRLIEARESLPHLVRVDRGRGGIYRTNLLVKMLSLLLNGLARLDPYVTGLEMDAAKPGWCDALNGLPGILGSSTGEVFGLRRLIAQMRTIAAAVPDAPAVPVPIEILEFMRGMAAALQSAPETVAERYGFWERTHRLRDQYLRATRLGLDGREEDLPLSGLADFLEGSDRLLAGALARAVRPADGLYHTYFYYQVRRWRPVESAAVDGAETGAAVWPEEFDQCALPLFLEGQTHAMRGAADREQALALHRAVGGSELYDRELGMYKICADLAGAPAELGRIKVFPRGWLENESVFLHMEYKYLLEILRSGLYEEFFAELPKLLTCFMDPGVYGRNPLENCSFIASSVHPRPDRRGNGFIARLSGSTAEMLQIWTAMSFGWRPFRVDGNGELQLVLAPILAASFFGREERRVEVAGEDGRARSHLLPADSYAALFLGRTLVVYANPGRRDTFGPGAARIASIKLTAAGGEEIPVPGPTIAGDKARLVRSGRIERIDVLLR